MEPIWIELRDALAIHDRMLALHGGAAGVRDSNLLESALARPLQRFAYDPSAGGVELAAAYTFGVVKNHFFADGNKRTGFVVGVLFLELNGFLFQAGEEDAANAVLQLAGGAVDEAGYADFLGRNSRPEDC